MSHQIQNQTYLSLDLDAYSPIDDAISRTHLAGAILLAASNKAECNYYIRERHAMALVNCCDPKYSNSDVLLASTWGLESAQELHMTRLATYASQLIHQLRSEDATDII